MTNKPVAKTPDVRVELAAINLDYLKLCKVRNDYSPAIVEPELTGRVLDEIIQPIIEAARTERDEYWKDKITTYITSDVRRLYHGC